MGSRKKAELLRNIVMEANSIDGRLEAYEFRDVDDLGMYFEGLDPYDIICRAHFGDFNPSAEYFQFDGYANIQSYHDFEIIEELLNAEEEILTEYLDLEDGWSSSMYYIEEAKELLGED